MKKTFIIVLMLFIVGGISLSFKKKELFDGESKLKKCEVYLPLTYASKDEIEYQKAAEELRGVKLVLLRYNRRQKQASYQYYYVVKDNTGKKVHVFLEKEESYFSKNNKKEMVFTKYNHKKDRFYKADCFDEVLKQNNSLKKIIKME